MLICAAASK